MIGFTFLDELSLLYVHFRLLYMQAHIIISSPQNSYYMQFAQCTLHLVKAASAS